MFLVGLTRVVYPVKITTDDRDVGGKRLLLRQQAGDLVSEHCGGKASFLRRLPPRTRPMHLELTRTDRPRQTKAIVDRQAQIIVPRYFGAH